MPLNPYLSFNGQCEEAFTMYQKVLGGKITAMFPHEGSPAAEHVPPEWRKKIMHAQLVLDGHILMGADTPPNHYEKPRGFSVTAGIADPQEAERVFQGLSEGGKVMMPIAETFWADRFGILVDRFGIPWMVNCEKKQQ